MEQNVFCLLQQQQNSIFKKMHFKNQYIISHIWPGLAEAEQRDMIENI